MYKFGMTYDEYRDTLCPPSDVWDDPTNEEDEPHEIFDGCKCPVCGKPMLSNVEVVCATWHGYSYNCKHQAFFHRECLTDEVIDLLEAMGFTLVEEIGSEFED
jgi:hypothetical protein